MTEAERIVLEETLLEEFDEIDKNSDITAVLGYSPSNTSSPTDEDVWLSGIDRFFDDNPTLINDWSAIENVPG